MTTHPLVSLRQARQRGSVLVQFALLALVLVSILGVVQIGYMYYAKRDLQRIADLAALEAVNALTYGNATTCGLAEAAANQSISAQLRLSLANEERQIDCGNWNASRADASRFMSNGTLNAARVTVSGETLQLLPSFLGSRIVAATAVAAKDSEPWASFLVGSQLLRFEKDALLGQVLSAVGLDVERLTVLDKDGIANAKVTPAGLLEFLGLPVGVNDLSLLSPNDLANIDVSALQLIDAAINAGGDSLLNAGVDIAELVGLRAYLAALELANIKVPLGGDRGLLAIISAGGNVSPIGAGLDVAVDLADLVRTQLAIANGENAIKLDLEIPGLVSAGLTVVEPPTIAIGPADGNTKARSAQVRLGIYIGEKGGANSEIGALGFLGVNLKLPIQIDLVRSTGTLEAIQCSADASARSANISVHSAVGDICIGSLDSNGVCQDTELLDLDLLNILGGLTIKSHASISLLGSSTSTTSNPVNPQQCPFNGSDECLIGMQVGDKEMSGPNGLRLGETVGGLLSTILGLVSDVSNAKVQGVLGVVLYPILLLLGGLQFLLDLVVGIVGGLLTPILNALGAVLDILLVPLLGTEIGRAEVELLSLQCDTAQLVQ